MQTHRQAGMVKTQVFIQQQEGRRSRRAQGMGTVNRREPCRQTVAVSYVVARTCYWCRDFIGMMVT